MLIEYENFINERENLSLSLTDSKKLDFFKIVEEPDLKTIKKCISLTKNVLDIYKTRSF